MATEGDFLKTISSVNPFDPEQTVAEAQVADDSQIQQVLDLSTKAQRAWRSDAMLRSGALSALGESIAARRDEFIDMMVREVGKPVPEAEGELERALAILRYYSQVVLDSNGTTYPGSTPGAKVLVQREPLGVVLAICPWNFPLAIPLWKAAPAMAYGNSVIMKPATPAIGTAALLQECVDQALPEGVLQQLVISGARAGDLLDDPVIAGVTFTGSTEVGISVAERMARRAAPAQAEMGGQNPAIVLADANLEAAADAIVGGALGFAGQKCTATRRVVAVAEVTEELESLLADRFNSVKVGDPAQSGVTAGPLISSQAVDETEDAVRQALDAGAREVAAADVPGGPGFFAQPRLLREDDPAATVNQEETFGPLLTLLSVADTEAAVAAANATRFGLVGAVHGRDLSRAAEVASQLNCGLRRINAPTPGVDFYAPFGGEGLSSFGPREQGRAAGEFFTATKTMTVIPAP
ncbi:MAG: aldehyde dehydrogenase family protein [Solirubrobacterales bacterium]